MKTIKSFIGRLAVGCVLALNLISNVSAQGTHFRATLTGSQVVPPNDDPTIGMGDFWLIDDVLNFQVDVPAITFTAMSGAIHGSALPGSLAPVIFDLGEFVLTPGSSQGHPPGYRFFSPASGRVGAGPFTLTSDQISQLHAGLWYVEVDSFTMPEGQLRGQILPVPEPSTLALIALSGLIVLFWRRRAACGLAVALALVSNVSAQGTHQFRATLTGSQVVPPNSDPTVGIGDFWLNENVLTFLVDIPEVTFTAMSGAIHGPALPGSLAPVIFNLGWPVSIPGPQGEHGGARFFSPFDGTVGAGPFTLTSDQISELQSGLWYVEVTSFTMPEGQLRGQILPVPEPSTLALVALSGLILLFWRRRAACGLAVALALVSNVSAQEETPEEVPYQEPPPIGVYTNASVIILKDYSQVPPTPASAGVPAQENSPAPSADFLGLADNNTRYPPDTHGAVGTNHVVTMLNSQVRIRTRTGTTLQTTNLRNFFMGTNIGFAWAFIPVIDPRIVYDPYHHRWIATAVDGPFSSDSRILIGVSRTSSPTNTGDTGWNLRPVKADSASQAWADFPTLGFNKDWIVVQANMWLTNGQFSRSHIYVFNKTNLYAGNFTAPTLFTNAVNAGVEFPAVTYDNSFSTLYLVQRVRGQMA